MCSWRLRTTEPDTAAFQHLAALCATSPDELLPVDDSPNNVAAARAAGWTAEVVTDVKELRDALAAHEQQ